MKPPDTYGRFTQALTTWKQLRRRKPASWDAARVLIDGAELLDRDVREQLHSALEYSDRELSPLRDPLRLNVGTHRWLSSDREESYSDWLAWILQGIESTTAILRLFGLEGLADPDSLGKVEEVCREQFSDFGRTDVEVHFGNRGLFLVEVKVRPPTDNLASQLRRYRDRTARLQVKVRLFALLALTEPGEQIDPFVFTSWRAFCQRLRNYANQLKNVDILRAAGIVIFCGAVEQNLLGLSEQPKRFRAAPTVSYLLRWKTLHE
jgi:hypothetical protein